MSAIYKEQPVFGVFDNGKNKGSGSNDFIKWSLYGYISTSAKNFFVYYDGYYYLAEGTRTYRTKDFYHYECILQLEIGSTATAFMITDGTQLIAKKNNNKNYLYLSSNGLDWIEQKQTALKINTNKIICFKNKYIAMSGNTTNSLQITETLGDWNEITLPKSVTSFQNIDNKIIFAHTYYSSTKPLLYSEDGENWFEINDIGLKLNIGSITKLDNFYYAVSINHLVLLKSADGKTWEIITSIQDSYNYSLISFKGRLILSSNRAYVFKGNDIIIMPVSVSKDGIVWEELKGTYNYGLWETSVINNKIFITPRDDRSYLLIGE